MPGGLERSDMKISCRFFLLRYVPDAVKNEFVNIGLVLLPPAGSAEVRFTRDWSRVRCLDPQVDVEVLEALESDLREKLREINGDHEFILRRIQDSFSNALQPTEFQGCLAESPGRSRRIGTALPGAPATPPVARAEHAPGHLPKDAAGFEAAGVWPLMWRAVPVARYTRSGDPLKIDCGYSPNGTVKLFHAVSLAADVNTAKVLAFTFPQLARRYSESRGQTSATNCCGGRRFAGRRCSDFARETFEQHGIHIAPAAEMPQIAAAAARELGIR